MNNSGKALTVFLIVIIVLLVSLSGIAVFFFVKEIEIRKTAQLQLEQLRVVETALRTDLQTAEKQVVLLEDKGKEAEGKIESLIQEVEFEQGLKEELKKEVRELKDKLESVQQAKDDLQETLSQEVEQLEDKLTGVQEEQDLLLQRNAELEKLRDELKTKYEEMEQHLLDLQDVVPAAGNEGEGPKALTPAAEELSANKDSVQLAPIVVNATGESNGQIISVDKETDFIIITLGERHGVKKGTVLSVFREEKYLGDVSVSRVLPEMSAADFIPPLQSAMVRKDDRVQVKQ